MCLIQSVDILDDFKDNPTNNRRSASDVKMDLSYFFTSQFLMTLITFIFQSLLQMPH